jgi:release factor glutamine methyltransferase
VAPEEEAAELREAADGDAALLETLVSRRLTGEPLGWIVGGTEFCGLRIRVDPGVYVPRPQSEELAERAAERLPADGVAVDLCTGSGAIGAVLRARRPGARVLGTDSDPVAVACATTNGVEALAGDLYEPLPAGLVADVIVGVVPYVPTPELPYLQRDTFAFEGRLAYDGGADGADLLRRAIAGARALLGPGGMLLLELGGEQADLVDADLGRAGLVILDILRDEDGDVRGIEAIRP